MSLEPCFLFFLFIIFYFIDHFIIIIRIKNNFIYFIDNCLLINNRDMFVDVIDKLRFDRYLTINSAKINVAFEI